MYGMCFVDQTNILEQHKIYACVKGIALTVVQWGSLEYIRSWWRYTGLLIDYTSAFVSTKGNPKSPLIARSNLSCV